MAGLITREELERREQETLRPWAMRASGSRGREHGGSEHRYRTPYQRDRDRIVHSTAFRRLEYKTQVFVNHEDDYYRTRLTHTMEVAQIARSVARALGANEDLTEALALAHDLGHGPFGHSGEHALDDLMRGHGGFDHNRHGLRVVEWLERRYPLHRGLDLSYEVRESMVKHGFPPAREIDPRYRPEEGPLIECQVADVCDAIAYNNHDLDDGLTSGILTEAQVREIEIVDRAFAAVDADHPRLKPKGSAGRVRTYGAIVRLIDAAVTDLIESTLAKLGTERIETIDDVRASRVALVTFSPEMATGQADLHAMLFRDFYRHYRIARMQEKARRFLTELFNAYVECPVTLPPEVQAAAEEEGVERAVCDYIASMTDRRAQDEYVKLFHPFERV